MPLLSRLISSEEEYFTRKDLIHEEIKAFLDESVNLGLKKLKAYFNSLDEKKRGLGGVYLSLLGTSAEDADSGQVGRGNRVNGLISVNRPMGTEAVAGKNPVSHVGKIYNVLAHKIAKEIYENVEGVREVYVSLLSKIGSPIDKPMMAMAQALLEQGKRLRDIKPKVENIIGRELYNVRSLCLELSEGKYTVC
jgi:S-adenosylmethionine synthetase